MTSLPPANEEMLNTDGHFETAAGDGTGESVRGSRWERAGPILTLLVLAPAIAEVLSGATRLTFIFVLIPEIMVWGCGSLICREIVRRWRAGWTSLLLLGLALAVAEEFIIQQTSLAPLPWLSGNNSYGRMLGVNWVYFLYMLGYESIWVVLLPVQLTELIFPDNRDRPWLQPRGIAVAIIVFFAGAFIAWYAWTQQARPNAFHAPIYSPPITAILAGLTAIASLALAAYAFKRADRRQAGETRNAPSAWLAFAVALLLGFPWYVLLVLVFVPNPPVPAWVAVIAGCAWAIVAFLILRNISSRPGWGDLHRWALIFGAMLVCMLCGFLGSNAWPAIDLVGKVVMNLGALIWMLWFGRTIRRGGLRGAGRPVSRC